MSRLALLIIDVQEAFVLPGAGERNNVDAEHNISRLLTQWRATSSHILHVKHDSLEEGSALRPGSPGNALQACVIPLDSEPVFVKSVNSAFIGTGLEQYLREQDIESLVVVGLTTDHCVSTTVRMASNLGFEVRLVADATATFERYGPNRRRYSAELVHTVNIASLSGEFCTVITTDQALSL